MLTHLLFFPVELIPVRDDPHPADPPYRRRPTPPTPTSNGLHHLEALRRGDIEFERVTVGPRRPLHPSQHLDPSPPPPGRSYPPVPHRLGVPPSPPGSLGQEYQPGPPPNREIPRGAVLIPPAGLQDRRRTYSPTLPPASQGLPTATFHHRPVAGARPGPTAVQNGIHPLPTSPARENGHSPGILSLGEHAPRHYGPAQSLRISPPSLPPQGNSLPLPGPSHTITSNGVQFDNPHHRLSLPHGRPPAGLPPLGPGLPIAGMPRQLQEMRQEFAPPSPVRDYVVPSPSNSSSSGTPASGSVNSFQDDPAHRSPGGGSVTPGSVGGQGLFPTPPPSGAGTERRGGRPSTR